MEQDLISETLARLRTTTQYVQKSQEWLDVRKTLMTASDASAVLRRTPAICKQYMETFDLPHTFADGKAANPYCSAKQYTLRKHDRAKPFVGSVATEWGNRFEDVACDIYKRLYETDVQLFGLLRHADYDWLAASPDGVTDKGVLLEIKCPFKRKITGIPPFYYWVQVQIQLEVLDLYSADFFEVEFVEYSCREQFIADEIVPAEREAKGVYVKKDAVTSICPPMDLTDPAALLDWADKVVQENPIDCMSVVCWKMIHYENTTILRSKDWFETARPVLYLAHTRVQATDPETLPNYNVPPEEVRSKRFEPTRKRGREMAPAPMYDICGGSSDCE